MSKNWLWVLGAAVGGVVLYRGQQRRKCEDRFVGHYVGGGLSPAEARAEAKLECRRKGY